jgi:hypothetical protein
MNKLLLSISFLISIICLTSESWALSKCKGEKKSSFWNNCIGKMTYSSGTTYFGAFKDNLPNGYGEYNRLDGGSYRGYSKNGLLHGQGIHIYMPDGSSYSGEWKNNKFDGKGIFKPGAKFV